MENNYQANDEQTVDLLSLVKALIKKLHVIILAAVIGALIGGFVPALISPPEYTATAKLYIATQGATKTDFTEIAQSRSTIQETILKLERGEHNYTDIGVKNVQEGLKVSFQDTSNIMEISVTNRDPYLASDIANAQVEATVEYIKSITGVENMKIVESADIPNTADGSGGMKKAMYGGVIGFLIAVVVICALYLADTTIRTRADIEHYLGLRILAEVPDTRRGRRRSAKKTNGSKQGGAK